MVNNPQGLPNFFILGAAKSGTTSLAYYLSQHPEIFITPDKETHFFTSTELFSKGVNFYCKTFFKNAHDYKVRGEATPNYLSRHEVVVPRFKQIYQNQPLKFIIILRDPVKRAWSHYQHLKRNFKETLTFEQALSVEEQRKSENPEAWFGYFSDGLYADQIEHWYANFGAENFLVLESDELKTDPGGVLKTIFRFLNVDEEFIPPDMGIRNVKSKAKNEFLMKFIVSKGFIMTLIKRIFPLVLTRRVGLVLRQWNTTKASDADQEFMAINTQANLYEHYADNIKRLELLLGRQFPSWQFATQVDSQDKLN